MALLLLFIFCGSVFLYKNKRIIYIKHKYRSSTSTPIIPFGG